jgi:putative spermidine/putrescine transport system ATP-binding protein
MSDRIVVFNRGRVEQVGSPAEVYERPSSEFVAGFVGTSNLLRSEAAQTILGEPATFSIRPEKLRLADPGTWPEPGEGHADGVIREVVYVGSATRFVVTLDAGGELVALRQNAETFSGDTAAGRGTRVRLLWSTPHVYRVPDAASAAP